jgi:hypothetical protein
MNTRYKRSERAPPQDDKLMSYNGYNIFKKMCKIKKKKPVAM